MSGQVTAFEEPRRQVTWDSLLEAAKIHQQDFYELLPEFTIYEEAEYQYLRQNIGFALFGPPTERNSGDQNGNNNLVQAIQEEVNTDGDLIEMLHYENKAERILNDVFTQICKCGRGYSNDTNICYGVIFIILLPRKEEGNNGYNEGTQLQLVPIFKIRKRNAEPLSQNEEEAYTNWYIDINCRVYKNWQDYKENNTLHQCTMVYPKDGFYQPNPDYQITETYSVVWLETEESPACSTLSNIVSAVDTTSTVLGVGGMVVGIASCFTPIGPVILTTGMVATGVNAVWSTARSTQNLVDRYKYEQSISPGNMSAFGSWLGIAGTVVGIASIGSTALLARATRNGQTISMLSRIAHNSLLIGNIAVSGVGITLQAYNIYENYQQTGNVDSFDTLLLATHFLFLGNAVINMKFAGELIQSTQGQVLEEYQSSLRSRRLRKAFNRTRRNAAASHMDSTAQNAEVIRYINNKRAAAAVLNPGTSVPGQVFRFQDGQITVNGIILIDPLRFVARQISREILSMEENDEGNVNEERTGDLRQLLSDLLTNYFGRNDISEAHVPDIHEFDRLVEEMQNMEDAESLLRTIFSIAMFLRERSRNLENFIAGTMFFLWRYLKANLSQFFKNAAFNLENSRISRYLITVANAILACMETIVQNLISALTQYIRIHRPHINLAI